MVYLSRLSNSTAHPLPLCKSMRYFHSAHLNCPAISCQYHVFCCRVRKIYKEKRLIFKHQTPFYCIVGNKTLNTDDVCCFLLSLYTTNFNCSFFPLFTLLTFLWFSWFFHFWFSNIYGFLIFLTLPFYGKISGHTIQHQHWNFTMIWI